MAGNFTRVMIDREKREIHFSLSDPWPEGTQTFDGLSEAEALRRVFDTSLKALAGEAPHKEEPVIHIVDPIPMPRWAR